MTYQCILAWDFQIGVGKADIPQYNTTRFLSLHCTSKPFHTQVDSLWDEGDSEYKLPVSLLDNMCLDLCPCTTAWERCDITHLLKYCTSQCHMKTQMHQIWLVIQDPELLSQQNQGMAWSVPDPFPFSGAGSGNETTLIYMYVCWRHLTTYARPVMRMSRKHMACSRHSQ